MCLLISAGHAIEIWSVGFKNDSNAEFLPLPLSLDNFAPFAEKGFSITIPNDGTPVDSKQWPSYLPGELDAWAGSKSYFLTVTFDLPTNYDVKGAEVYLELHGMAQHPSPPTLEIALNDSKQVLNTDSEPNEHWSSYKIDFDPNLLKPKGNTLRITNTKGSWFQFDAVQFVAFKGKIETMRLTPLPGILRGHTRRVQIDFSGEKLKDKAMFCIESPTMIARRELEPYSGITEFVMDFPVDPQSPGEALKVTATLTPEGGTPITAEATIPSERLWTMHLIHQTHLDIGYTHVQTEILERQVQSIRDALKYIEETKDYPEEAKFRFHPEGMWAVEAFLEEATAEEKAAFIKAAKTRDLHIDGMYAQAMTGMYNDEELFELFGNAARFCRENGIVLDSVMQTDIPGYTWGLVPAMYQNGIRYMTMGPNCGHRVGRVYEPWGDKPFWWVSPSGQEKVLCWLLDTGYHQFLGKKMGHVISESEVFRLLDGDDLLFKRNRSDKRTYLFDDLVVIRYGIEGDNGRPNRALSDAVKAWNEKFLYPKLVISRNSDVMRILETKYGDKLPVLRGDYSPYWEDGSASTSEATSIDRRACEKIIQTQILWAMLNPTRKLSADFDSAWTNLIMYDEHTWGAFSSISDPDSDFAKTQDAFKQEYAKRGSREVDTVFDNIVGDSPALKKGTKDDMVLVNTTSRGRWGIHFIGKAPKTDKNLRMYKNSAGRHIPVQAVADPNNSELCSLYAHISFGEASDSVPALGMISLSLDEKAPVPNISSSLYVNAETGEMGNDMFRLVIDKQSGAITSLKLKTVNHEFVDVGSDGNRGLNDYLYIIGRNAEENRSRNEGPVKLTVVADGPLAASVLVETAPGATPNAGMFKRQITIFADTEKIRIENIFDKKMERQPEGTFFGFPFNIPNGKWFLDMPWALVEVDKDQLLGGNRNYYSLQRYAVCANDKIGVNWVTVDANMMQFAPILFTGASDPLDSWRKEFQPGGTLYSWVCSNHWETNYKADQEGLLRFEYWIWPYAMSFDNTVAQRFARQVHQPLLRLDGVSAVNSQAAFLALEDSKNIVISSVRPTRDGNGALSVRLFNPSPSPHSTKLQLPQRQKVYRSNPLEERLEELSVITLAPWEIMAVRIE
jgi:hypothetical protein